jgi:hypothetical protein
LIFTATSFISPDNWCDIKPLLQRGRNQLMSMNPTRLRVEGRLPSRDYLINHARQGKNQEIEGNKPRLNPFYRR